MNHNIAGMPPSLSMPRGRSNMYFPCGGPGPEPPHMQRGPCYPMPDDKMHGMPPGMHCGMMNEFKSPLIEPPNPPLVGNSRKKRRVSAAVTPQQSPVLQDLMPQQPTSLFSAPGDTIVACNPFDDAPPQPSPSMMGHHMHMGMGPSPMGMSPMHSPHHMSIGPPMSSPMGLVGDPMSSPLGMSSPMGSPHMMGMMNGGPMMGPNGPMGSPMSSGPPNMMGPNGPLGSPMQSGPPNMMGPNGPIGSPMMGPNMTAMGPHSGPNSNMGHNVPMGSPMANPNSCNNINMMNNMSPMPNNMMNRMSPMSNPNSCNNVNMMNNMSPMPNNMMNRMSPMSNPNSCNNMNMMNSNMVGGPMTSPLTGQPMGSPMMGSPHLNQMHNNGPMGSPMNQTIMNCGPSPNSCVTQRCGPSPNNCPPNSSCNVTNSSQPQPPQLKNILVNSGVNNNNNKNCTQTNLNCSGPNMSCGPPGSCNSQQCGPCGPNVCGPRMNQCGPMGSRVMMPPPSMGPMGMMGPMNMGPKPLPVTAGKIYPPDQPMVFNPQNPNAPPIYPCGICHKEVHDNDQAILCESGCNFWFHRMCTGLSETAYQLLTAEVYAEWVCDKCLNTKSIPLVKFKP